MLNVFISYAKEDQSYALEYYEKLKSEGVQPWLDKKFLLPGHNWEIEIEKAFNDANVIVLLMTPRSVGKRGFVQREASDAIERLRYKKADDIYILPLVLEPCDVPVAISNKLQYLDMSSPQSWEQVQRALSIAAEQQQIDLQRGAQAGPFRVFSDVLEESRSGYPGYEVRIEFPRFVSVKAPAIAMELSMMFAGQAVNTIFSWRGKPWDQESNPEEVFPCAEDFPPVNSLTQGFGIAFSSDKILSMTIDMGHYFAGAAHGNVSYKAYNFSLIDGVIKLSLSDFLDYSKDSLKKLSSLVVEKLCKEYWERTGARPDQSQIDWFISGAGESWDNFNVFNVNSNGFTFIFPPYQVSAYAMGPWSVDVDFYDLLDYLRENGPHQLLRNEDQNSF